MNRSYLLREQSDCCIEASVRGQVAIGIRSRPLHIMEQCASHHTCCAPDCGANTHTAAVGRA